MFGEEGDPKIRVDSLETFGQFLKVSTALDAKVLPYLVNVPKKGRFFRSVYERLYLGKGEPSEKDGSAIERMGMVATNDLGELILGKSVFSGDNNYALTDESERFYYARKKLLKDAKWPVGWVGTGPIHSHPEDDLNTYMEDKRLAAVDPKLARPATWSAGDFLYFLSSLKRGEDTSFGLITPTQLSFMVATSLTKQLADNPYQFAGALWGNEDREKSVDREVLWASEKILTGNIRPKETMERILSISVSHRPPFCRMSDVGIVVYGGEHADRIKDSFVLKRSDTPF